MRNQDEKRTYLTVMMQVMREMGGEQMEREFMRLFSSRINPETAGRELTEEQYQDALQKLKEELPHIKRYLLTHSFSM